MMDFQPGFVIFLIEFWLLPIAKIQASSCTQNETHFSCISAAIKQFPRNKISLKTTHIDLSGNDIERLNKMDFDNLKNLVYLNLDNNKISQIDDYCFSQLINLEELRISGNTYLKTIPKNVFYGSTNLKTLYLSDNSLNAIPDLDNLGNLENLDLSSNGIVKEHAKFPPSFQNMVKLKTLNMGKNAIRQITSQNLENLHSSSIEVFILRENGLSDIQSNAFSSFINLRELDLSTNTWLSYTSLMATFDSLQNAVHLKILRLDDIDNEYDISQDIFQKLENCSIDVLSLAGSKINTLANNAFSRLKRLTTLNLTKAIIKFIEDRALAALNYLTVLDMSGKENPEDPSKTWIIPSNFFPNTLTVLNLSGRYLANISKHTFDNLKYLQNLSLHNCKLTQFDSFFLPTDNSLQNLDISQNDFSSFIPKLINLKDLKFLDISHTYLGKHLSITGIFENLTKLSYLRMEFNELKIITAATFKDVLHLKYLSIANNQLCDLQNWNMNMWKERVVIDLRNNNLRCDCYLQWLRRWMDESKTSNVNLLDYENYICGNGGPNAGEKMISISVDHFTCGNYAQIKVSLISGICILLIIVFGITAYSFTNRWYIRWHCYNLFHHRSRNYDDEENRFLNNKKYDTYVSYFSSDEEIARQIVSYLEMPLQHHLNNMSANENDCRTPQINVQVVNESNMQTRTHSSNFTLLSTSTANSTNNSSDALVCEYTIPSRNNAIVFTDANNGAYTPINQQIPEIVSEENSCSNSQIDPLCEVQLSSCSTLLRSYRACVESKDAPMGEWTTKSLVEAVYSSRNAIVCLSRAYLKNRRRQFELRLILKAMTDYYRSAANKHIVFIVLLDDDVISENLLPNQFTGCTVLRWPKHNTDNFPQFWQQLRSSCNFN